MKGILLAGGSGTRLKPLTDVVCKQLLPVFDKPMIYYPLSTLIHAGVDEICLITSESQVNNFKEILKDGRSFGITIDYLVQEKPIGLPNGIQIAEHWLAGEDFWYALGDNLFHGPDFGTKLKSLTKSAGCTIFAYRVNDPSSYGVIHFNPSSDEIASIEEKPKASNSKWAIPGLYYFDNSAVERANALKPGPRGELEIVDLMKSYLSEEQLKAHKISRGNAWFDLGTAENLLSGANFVHAIQSRQGLLVGSPEEAGMRAGQISSESVTDGLQGKITSSYFELLNEINQKENW